MYLFYNSQATPGATVLLDAGEAMHIAKVLRKKEGDTLQLTDGKGKLYEGTLHLSKREAAVVLKSFEEKPPRMQSLELAIAPTKNQDRLEWFIEKAVEIGVEKITLLHCEHSERVHIREERLHRVAAAAMKQSLKFYMPEITAPIDFKKWITQTSQSNKCIAHCHATGDKVFLQNALKGQTQSAIAIGPEGDFSENEVNLAHAQGFISVSLGHARLRTETAAMCAVHTFELVHQII
jgi:16S rRNA (uracil1498-N3)-methyltransferase